VRQLAHPQVIDDEERHGRELSEGGLAGPRELRLGEVLEQDMELTRFRGR
jgi:hypothetical protein